VAHDAHRDQGRETTMQYILINYVKEDGWSKLTKAEQEQGMAAYIGVLGRP